MDSTIGLIHGSGGRASARLLQELFYRYFSNPILLKGLDAAALPVQKERLAFTTDSYVVKPYFFPGGDIGKLAVCGTINDLCVAGAKPLYMSCSMIIEEGFSMGNLERIVKSMADTARHTGINIVTGDTKVVEKGSADGIFINTSGIGVMLRNYEPRGIMPGDRILITGTIAEHGTVIGLERYKLPVKGNFQSDCAPMNHILDGLEAYMGDIKVMKDPTRGGVATILYELSQYAGRGIHLMEDHIPIRREVLWVNELLGIDPLHLACEGRILMVVDGDRAGEILSALQSLEGCEDAKSIGSFTEDAEGMMVVENSFGGKRIIGPLEGDTLPRIC